MHNPGYMRPDIIPEAIFLAPRQGPSVDDVQSGRMLVFGKAEQVEPWRNAQVDHHHVRDFANVLPQMMKCSLLDYDRLVSLNLDFFCYHASAG